MDINNLLKMLGENKSGGKDLINILSLLNSDKNSGKNVSNLFASAISNGNPDVTKLMNLYQNNKPRGYGLKPVTQIASDEILGILLKFFAKH